MVVLLLSSGPAITSRQARAGDSSMVTTGTKQEALASRQGSGVQMLTPPPNKALGEATLAQLPAAQARLAAAALPHPHTAMGSKSNHTSHIQTVAASNIQWITVIVDSCNFSFIDMLVSGTSCAVVHVTSSV